MRAATGTAPEPTVAAEWHTVAGLCTGLPELPRHAAELFAEHGEALVVTHLPWPEAGSTGYSLVMFVHHGELWSTIAAYNRQRLEEQRHAEPFYRLKSQEKTTP